MKRITSIFVVAALFLASGSQLDAQTDSTFSYQGELQENGASATGSFNMVFTLWSAAVGGSQLSTANTFNAVPVVSGRFNVELDFGATSFVGDARWLQIAVEGTTLSPRQLINRSPYAIQTRGMYVDGQYNVGMGTIFPDAPLHVEEGNAGSVTGHFNSSAIFERSANNYVTVLSPNNNERGILFGDPESFVNGGIVYNNANTLDGFQFRTGGNISNMEIDAVGRVGIPDVISTAKLGVTSSEEDKAIFALSLHTVQPTINAVNVGGGAAIWTDGSSDTSLAGGGLILAGSQGGFNISIDHNEIMARNAGATSGLLLNREGGDVVVGSASGGTSKLITPVLQITGGADFSEMFDVRDKVNVRPGMVVSIDPHDPGRLILSATANDRKVAGIISGAGGVATGMTMGHDGTIADGKYPVALTGRVYCLVDGTSGAVEPGDMLTTSETPGHAMKATDLLAAQGAIIGKAMTSLDKGETGLVLVLVNLQ